MNDRQFLITLAVTTAFTGALAIWAQRTGNRLLTEMEKSRESK